MDFFPPLSQETKHFLHSIQFFPTEIPWRESNFCQACKRLFNYCKICWNKSEISQCNNITPLDHSTQRSNQDSHWVCPFFSTTPKGILLYNWIHSSTEKTLANFLFLSWKNLCKDSCHQREWESLLGHSFPPGFAEGLLQPVRQQQQRQPVFFAIKRKPLIILATQMSISVPRCEWVILEEKWTSRIITKT